jgi:hypothetical protein
MNAITPPDTPATRAAGNSVDLSEMAPCAGPGVATTATVSVGEDIKTVAGPTMGELKSVLANMLGTRGLLIGFKVVAVLVGSDTMKDPRDDVVVNAMGVGKTS